jgi:putative transposase
MAGYPCRILRNNLLKNIVLLTLVGGRSLVSSSCQRFIVEQEEDSRESTILLAVKAVQQNYTPNSELLGLLEQFRQMVNDSVRIGLAENVTSLKSLSLKTYRQLQRYDAMSYYRLCAISKAAGILKNHRKAQRGSKPVKQPYARRPQLTTCYGFRISNGKLQLPVKPANKITIPLNRHTLHVLSGADLAPRSVTLTLTTITIVYSKDAPVLETRGLMGIDRNLDNVTVADSNGSIKRHNLAEATEIKALYREVKSHVNRNDYRVKQRVYAKYGVRQHNRVKQLVHRTSKQIIAEAKRNRSGIVMERLTGIRKLYQKGNGQGRDYRARMSGWSFTELQRQVEYKARWEGLLVIYVNPYGTSVKCSICGSRMKPEENRKLKCQSCRFTVDRDVNAARNILAAGMRALRFGAVASATEAMVAVQRRPVDADELTQRYPPTS